MAFNSKTVLQSLFIFSLAAFAACSHAPKKTPELSKMEGRKVALVDVDGPETSKTIVETALINQLVQHGSFILVSKHEVEAARIKPGLNSADYHAVAQEAGADFALRAKVLRFDATSHEGYSDEEVEDSQMKEETGEAKTKRLYKVKSLTGDVAIQLEFTDLKTSDIRIGVAEDHDEVTSEGRTSAAHLPPRMRFLENMANEAFRKFFDRYN